MTADVELRPLSPADIPAWAALLNACADIDGTGEHYGAGDLEEELANPELDVERDTVAALVDGQLAAYGQLVPRSAEGEHRLHVDGMTHPDLRGRGAGTAVLGRLVDRAHEIHRDRFAGLPWTWTAMAPVGADDALDLLARHGFAVERYTVDMVADLRTSTKGADVDGLIETVAGLEVRAYDPARDEIALFEAHNAAFVDHPGFTPWSPTMWRQHVTGSRSFRPALTVVAVDPARPDEVAAYVQSAEFDAHEAVTGRRQLWVAKVGTRRAHRGRGVAQALLTSVLSLARAAGYDEAGLDVDSENPTGALGVYERAGFRAVRSRANAVSRG